MTIASKLFLGLAGISTLGLIWALADIVTQSTADTARAARLNALARQAPPLPPAPAPPAHGTPPNWVFTLRAEAQDDPESARSTSSSIVFQGAALTCQDPHPRAQFALAVDRTGTAAAHARREQRVCVPGCEGRPPVASTRPLARHLGLTAFQEQFDRAADDYAPEGRISVLQWTCEGRITRLVAASVVALACNSAECNDVQVANAAVHLGYDSGRALDDPQALFVLRSVGGGFAVANASGASAAR